MQVDLEARLKRLMLFRVVMVTTLLFIATYFEAVISETLLRVNPLYFVIGANGRVKSAQAKEPTSDEALNQCILNHLMKWPFPMPHGGIDVGVSFPFIFKLLGA